VQKRGAASRPPRLCQTEAGRVIGRRVDFEADIGIGVNELRQRR